MKESYSLLKSRDIYLISKFSIDDKSGVLAFDMLRNRKSGVRDKSFLINTFKC